MKQTIATPENVSPTMSKTAHWTRLFQRSAGPPPFGFFMSILALILACALISCQSPSGQKSSSPAGIPEQSLASVTNILREGDVIQITFEGATNLNTTLKIPLDGTIALQFVGKIKVAGRTPLDLETNLMALYENQVKATQINVVVILSSSAVYVSGAVFKPGKILLDRPLTLMDAVMEAGGVDHTRAKLTKVTLLRIENGRRQMYYFDLKRALKGKEPPLFYLKPFDIIYVPERTFNL